MTQFTLQEGCRGSLAITSSGSDGFGFDPIFIPDDVELHGESITTNGLTFADVGLPVKEKFSHRRKALDGLIDLLSTPETASSS